jgi:polysaccharide biosynthesis transport protein
MTEDSLGLSHTIGKVLGTFVRRRWLIISCICAVTAGVITVLFYLPNQYTSEATIFAVGQRVPERYVVSTATSDLSRSLEAMMQEVLSRPRLLSIVDELGLYPDQRQRLEPEQLYRLIRRDVTIEPVERKLGGRLEVNGFRISFVAQDPKMAQAATLRLTKLFIDQNLKSRADQAETTTEFLHEQLEIARKDLEQQEQRLRDFKTDHLGELPEQQAGILGILGSAQSQLDNVMASRHHAQQQRLYLESLLNDYGRRAKRPLAFRSSTGEALTPEQAAENDLMRLLTEKKALLAAYTATHPDVLRKENEIVQQRALIQALKSTKHPGADKDDNATLESSDSEQDTAVAQLKGQLRSNTLEIANLNSKEEKLRADITLYQNRLNLSPVREQQLTSIQRDYELVKQHYGELLRKQQESQLATDLEKRQEGQQFRLADPPNLPTVPSSPKRLLLSLVGLLGGIVLGCALAVLMEMRNTSFRSDDDALRQLDLPLVIGIPLLVTEAEVKQRSRWLIIEWIAGCALLIVVTAAEFYVYRHG